MNDANRNIHRMPPMTSEASTRRGPLLRWARAHGWLLAALVAALRRRGNSRRELDGGNSTL
jgi:rhamnogalacturonyl hydrolase YesR